MFGDGPFLGSSFADHPICQLLKKLQCSAYNRIYPLISQSRTDASRGWSLSSSLDAEVFLPSATEGRRLRSSQSLHSMYSVQEHNKLNLRHSISGTPFIEDQSLLLPPQEGRVFPPLADRESSFEDLEQFLSASEARPAGPLQSPLAGKKGSQKEALKAVVKDIHNSIGELPGAAQAVQPPWEGGGIWFAGCCRPIHGGGGGGVAPPS